MVIKIQFFFAEFNFSVLVLCVYGVSTGVVNLCETECHKHNNF
jgi:hypothetical protein